MSKLSFRARTLDTSKLLPVYIGNDIPEELDYLSVNRAVMEMPTGMEKDEESEHHLQRALSAQQAYGTAEALAIPIPGMEEVGERFSRLYCSRKSFKPPKQYIRMQLYGLDQELPDYDLDSEDENWLYRQANQVKLHMTPLKFENMVDRLEKGSGQVVVNLNEAKALLKEDDDLTIAVYDYWLNKRLRLQLMSLIPQVKTERRDGLATSNPYVAFRRRTERMQTRKNRKNDETSYEKILKLRRDLNRALLLLEMVKRREKTKKEHLKLTVEITEKRHHLQDWDGELLRGAEAEKCMLPRFANTPSSNLTPSINEWLSNSSINNDIPCLSQKKREYKKRKHKTSQLLRRLNHQTFTSKNNISHHSSVDDDVTISNSPQSECDSDSGPDGPYSFKRKLHCSYIPTLPNTSPRSLYRDIDVFSCDKQYKYHLASSSRPRLKCIGYVRQRIGRGGRLLFDRASTEWDAGLSRLDLSRPPSSSSSSPTLPHNNSHKIKTYDYDLLSDYNKYIRSNGILHYKQTIDEGGLPMSRSRTPAASPAPMPAEHYKQHVQLLDIQRKQRQLQQSDDTFMHPLLDGKSYLSLNEGLTSPLFLGVRYGGPITIGTPSSNLTSSTLDPQKAKFAVSAIQDLNIAKSDMDNDMMLDVNLSSIDDLLSADEFDRDLQKLVQINAGVNNATLNNNLEINTSLPTSNPNVSSNQMNGVQLNHSIINKSVTMPPILPQLSQNSILKSIEVIKKSTPVIHTRPNPVGGATIKLTSGRGVDLDGKVRGFFKSTSPVLMRVNVPPCSGDKIVRDVCDAATSDDNKSYPMEVT